MRLMRFIRKPCQVIGARRCDSLYIMIEAADDEEDVDASIAEQAELAELRQCTRSEVILVDGAEGVMDND